MVGMTAALLILTPLLKWLPNSGRRTGNRSPQHFPPVGARLRASIGLSVAAVMMFLYGITMIWAFVERMANDAGFNPVTTGNVLSLTLLFAVSGSLLAMWLGGRFGATKPLAVACLMLLFSLGLLGSVETITDYTIAASLFSLAFGLGVPCVVTVTADLDIDGRYVVLTVPAMGFGVMIAPASAGFLISAYGHAGVLWGGGLAVSAALVLVILAQSLGLRIARAERRRTGREAPEPIL
jgi:MFS family permease